MTSIREQPHATPQFTQRPWHDLAGRVLEGQRLSAAEGLAVLRSRDDELLDLLAAAYRVRHRRWGNKVRLNFLINAKSGACAEDCGYCSQSKVSKADIPRYGLVDDAEILDGARLAHERKAKTYCIVTAGRQPRQNEIDFVARLVPQIKDRYGLEICVSAGLLAPDQAARLKACGVDRVNHNLNTSRRYYPTICTTHAYQDRVDTLRAVRAAGMEICSGGIVGMGEDDCDVVQLALELGQLEVEALPVNFFSPIPGTPLGLRKEKEGIGDWGLGIRKDCAETSFSSNDQADSLPRVPSPLTPRYCLKVLCLFRLANPHCDLRVAAGRELHLGPLQPLALYPANSMFVGDYLTTKGQPPHEDYRMIEALGFEVVEE